MTNSSVTEPRPLARPTRVRSLAGRRMVLALTVTMLGLTAMWAYVTQRRLDAAVASDRLGDPDRARQLFELLRSRTRDSLRSECQILVEDPRLKASLATAGIDAATIADILRDLQMLRVSGFLLVLDADGRVFAEAGAAELRGLDLSGSSVVKRARSATEAIHGSWVIGKELIDLGIAAIQIDRVVLGYLVAGRDVDLELTRAVATVSGVATAVVIGDDIVFASSTDPGVVRATGVAVSGATPTAPHTIDLDGARYAIAAFELEGAGQSVARLATVRLAEAGEAFTGVHRLFWLPLVLVLMTIGFATSRMVHRDRRVS